MQVTQVEIITDVAAARRYVAENWGWFLGLGIVLVLAGIAAFAFPLLFTIATTILLGCLFLIGGAVLLAHGLRVRRWVGITWSLLVGVLYLLAGAYLAFFPLGGLVTLTILLAVLFVVEGIAEIVMGTRVRPHDGWLLLIVSGFVAIAAGVLITLGLPASSEWAIGLLVGINLVFTGCTYIFVALAARRAAAG
jgi:uncharacterized membrane protein HdeD (DUF308 family)